MRLHFLCSVMNVPNKIVTFVGKEKDMRKILVATISLLLITLMGCGKNDIIEVDTDGELITVDFFIINGGERDFKLHFVPYEGDIKDATLMVGDTIALRGYGKGDLKAAPLNGKIYITYDEDWIPFYAYDDDSKNICNPDAYTHKSVSANYYHATYVFTEADYEYWLNIKTKSEEGSEQ